MEDLVKMLQSYQPPQVTVKPLLPAEAEVVDSTRPPAQVTEVVSTAEQQSIPRRIESVATTSDTVAPKGTYAETAADQAFITKTRKSRKSRKQNRQAATNPNAQPSEGAAKASHTADTVARTHTQPVTRGQQHQFPWLALTPLIPQRHRDPPH
ncbi:hypothetical protein GN958_ATG20364 [Phytophthora infestans]|uniref:Uncharacterized protein n=1 Tax=Phytophthora infestans TaxID=4787 RepID=A0A8S9TPS5_PHYIN|nr:hypothetical protein GN958_ATG20364 [Phytophthora infestans]